MLARGVLAAALCAGVVGGVVASSAPARPATRSVFVDGDSLAVGTMLFLSRFLPGWTIRESIHVSRHAYEGLTPVKARGPALERVVVVDLGTNDDPSRVSVFTRAVRQILQAAGPSRCVVWPTINRPPYHGISWEAFNRALRRLAAENDNLRVYDWAAAARAHPSWFGADGVHPSFAGYRVRAAGIAKLVKGC